ncbi:MAG: TerB N-terminal domain-containing protein [Ruminiclostridium sp.]|nr:TerB N-terminal domain-containing protein [Ruminiclostridium sp.]
MEMRRLTDKSADYRERFYKQALFMEDYEDDFECSEQCGSGFLPTYDKLTSNHLRWYFSWRTKLRRYLGGYAEDCPEAVIPFIRLYAYELINRIGAGDAKTGYDRLSALGELYGRSVPEIRSSLNIWLKDYVIYYGLDRPLIPPSRRDEYHAALEVLSEPETSDVHEVFSAVCAVSRPVLDMESSEFYRTHRDTAEILIYSIYTGLAREFETRSKKRTYFGKLFGEPAVIPYRMFEHAVFYDKERYDLSLRGNRDYRVGKFDIYRCRGSFWTHEYYTPGGSTELGAVLRASDSIMREKFGFGEQTETGSIRKNVRILIEKTVERFIKQNRITVITPVEMDLSKLGEIRASADITRDKLSTDEDTDDLPYEDDRTDTTADICEEVPEESGDIGILDENERLLLSSLLYGGNTDLLRDRGIMLSVAADSINEKLFDLFGDNVIEFDGDVPCITEDYTDELKGMIKE